MEEIQGFIRYIREEKWNDCIAEQLRLLRSEGSFQFADFSSAYLSDLLNRCLDALNQNTEKTAFTGNKSIFSNKPGAAEIHRLLATQQESLVTFLPGYYKTPEALIKNVQMLQKFYARVLGNVLKQYFSVSAIVGTKLLESEEKYKDLFDNAHDLIHIVQPNGSILYVNNAWLQTMRCNEEDIKGRSIYSFVHEEDRDKFFEYRNNILSGTDASNQIILRLVSNDERIITVEGFISAKIKDGLPEYTRGIFRDITTRVENEQKLMHSNQQLIEREENLLQLIQNAPDAIIVIDAESMISLWNPKAEQVFGWKQDEVVNKALANIIVPESYRQAHTQGMRRYLSTGEAHVLNKTIEVTALNKDGREFVISLTISHFIRGGKNFFISFLRDIHQQKQNEKELHQKRKELEESNKELEQYAWLASHDLREPLRKILTYSDLVLTKHRTQLNEDVEKYIFKINGSAQRMGDLINSLLLYSSISHDEGLYKTVSLTTILEEVLGDLELLIADTGAKHRFKPFARNRSHSAPDAAAFSKPYQQCT